ncbi:MAG TPA: GNAT family protein [Steroidobacteraceae bacterium]|jgi:RimJ/RimL family protein N-acetyltransferase|nr:GNAT family protein [Steroidobacteraceae bacterium]
MPAHENPAPTSVERIQIGPITVQDSEPLFRWFNDPQAARLDYAWRPVDGMSHQKWISSVGTDASQIWFAIRRHGHPAIIGFAILRNISAVHRSAEFGLRIGEEADRGRGFGKQAASQVLQFAWAALNLNRIQVSVFAGNERALRLYAALGFKREGVLRRAQFIDGAWTNIIIMAALRPRATVRAQS